MKIMITILYLVIFLSSCADSTDGNGDARLRVTQHQLACCYMEGQVSHVQLQNAQDEVIFDKEFRAQDMIQPVFDETLQAGTYTLRTWQQPCSGNCGRLDPPRNQCETALELSTGTQSFITSAFSPGGGCSLTETAAPLQSTIPDRFAFREELAACGEDFPLQLALGIQGRSPTKTCFLEAWGNGSRAEASLWVRVSERAVRPRYHRILADRRIEVFIPPDNPQVDARWFYYQCLGLDAVNNVDVFTLEDCTEPEVLEMK